MTPWYWEPLKRFMDLVLSLVLGIIFLPVWLIIPILIKLDSSGPIFYGHKRVGKNGREFHLYKFRSMVQDADDILFKKNRQLLRKFKQGDWKLKHDPRITPLGRIIRSVTIDEFPQLLNVLKGEMSIVGPRAYLKKELEEQGQRHPETKTLIADILSVKPGITGPWQTSGRNEVPFLKRAKMDAAYARRKSLLHDIVILLKTPSAMFSKW
ncbi:MAG: sugar transferase [Candidatus Chisholmbacteria bacterium]|nr:sugar transferase [Candidatus Chisholmbacteria bacterium]